MNIALRPTPASATPSLWRWVGWGLAACVGCLCVLVLYFPAQWIAPVVHRLSGQRVLLVEPRGTVWQGSAFVALSSGPGGTTTTAWHERLQWQFSPSTLSSFNLTLGPQSHRLGPWNWSFAFSPAGLRIQSQAVDWRVPTAWLGALGAPFNTIEPEGQMRLQSAGYSWQRNGDATSSSGMLTLTLEQFSTRLSSLKPLGDYQLTLLGGSTPRVELKTLQGHLNLAGQGVWDNGRLRFNGEAWAQEASQEPVLANLLGVLGSRNGRRAILKVG